MAKEQAKKQKRRGQSWGNVLAPVAYSIAALVVGIVHWSWKLVTIVAEWLWGVVATVLRWVWQLVFGKAPEGVAVPEQKEFSDGAAVLRGSILATQTFVALALVIILLAKFPTSPVVPGASGVAFDNWQAVKAKDTATLSSYGWVDQSAGVVRMSIRDSMEHLVNGGLPYREETTATTESK